MKPSSILDTVLDRTVVLGYTNVGYAVRRRTWPADDPRPGSMAGKVAVVTGANSGLGKATAQGLAHLGATVVMVVRSLDKGEAARAELLEALPGADLQLAQCDVADLDSVRALVDDLTARLDRIDVLVHNAGALPPERQESPQGHEMTLAVHVLGPLLMTEGLRPLLAEAGEARVVLVASGGMYTQKLAHWDVEYTRGKYSGTVAYARTKRIQVAFTPLLQERYAADGITVHCMHPGWADTPGVATSLPGFHKVTGPLLRDSESGADTIVWLGATQPAPEGGKFWHDRRARTTYARPGTKETPEDLRSVWDYCLEAAGLT